jgi:hypothetical protein
MRRGLYSQLMRPAGLGPESQPLKSIRETFHRLVAIACHGGTGIVRAGLHDRGLPDNPG